MTNSAANYSINNGAILVSAAVLGADGKTVELTTAPIAKGSSNTLTVNGVRDVAGNQIVANSQIAVTFQRGALLVTADPGPLTFAGDNAVNQHLIDRGYDVELAQGSLVPDDGSTANGKDIILQSSSLGSGTVEIPDPAGGAVNVSKFKFLTIPAIEWEASSQDAFGFQGANGVTTASQTDVNIVDASSPLAAGLSAGLHRVVTSPQTFSQSGLATPPVGAHIVATLATDPTQRLSIIMTRVKKVLMTLSCPPVAYSSSSRITRLQRPMPMDGSSSMPQWTGRRISRSWLSPGLPRPPLSRLEASDCNGREVERSNKPTHYRRPIGSRLRARRTHKRLRSVPLATGIIASPHN